MSYLIQQLVTGLAVGGTYALVALGFVLIFGVLNMLNIAHAQTLMLAPLALVLALNAGVPLVLAVPLCLLATLLFSYLNYLISIRPFTGARQRGNYLAPFIASFGVSMAVENVLGGALGSEMRPFPLTFGSTMWSLGPINLVPMQVISLLVVGTVLAGLGWVVTRTALGRQMRAVAESHAIAEILGISAPRTTLIAIAIASLLGSVSGLLLAAGIGGVSPFTGLEYGLKGLVVMIIGGVSSLAGAVVVGLFLGVTEAFVTSFLSSEYRDVITYGVLFLVLLVRPQGLFRAASKEVRP